MRVYKGSFTISTVTAQLDIFEFVPAADKPLILIRFEIGQLSEIGDAGEEQLDLRLKRMATITTGTGGTVQGATAKVPVDPGDAAASYTLETGNTTKATATTTNELARFAWNVRMGLLYVPVPEERDVVAGTTNGFVLELAKTPADQIDTIVGSYTIAELA